MSRIKDSEIVLIDEEMAKRIWKERKKQKMRQIDLAISADVDEGTIKRIEKCRNGTTYRTQLYTLQKIATSLNISFEFILGELYSENRDIIESFVERWKRIQKNGELWFTYSGSGWDDCLDDMNITCSNYPVEKLIVAICGQGGRNLVIKGLKQYDELSENHE